MITAKEARELYDGEEYYKDLDSCMKVIESVIRDAAIDCNHTVVQIESKYICKIATTIMVSLEENGFETTLIDIDGEQVKIAIHW